MGIYKSKVNRLFLKNLVAAALPSVCRNALFFFFFVEDMGV
jgi:hypothetical protein